VCIAPTENMQW